jgi:hypothetical protein
VSVLPVLVFLMPLLPLLFYLIDKANKNHEFKNIP